MKLFKDNAVKLSKMYGIHSKQIKTLLGRQYLSKARRYDKNYLTIEIMKLLPPEYTAQLNPNTNYLYITKT